MITRNVSSKNPDLVVILREDGGRFVSRLSITSPSCVALTEPLVVVQLVSQDVVAFSVVCKVVATSTGPVVVLRSARASGHRCWGDVSVAHLD